MEAPSRRSFTARTSCRGWSHRADHSRDQLVAGPPSSPSCVRHRGRRRGWQFENLRQQLVIEFGRVHQDIAALNTWNQNSAADPVSVVVDKKSAAIDGLMANLGAQTMAVADRVTALEMQTANTQHLFNMAAERETSLLRRSRRCCRTSFNGGPRSAPNRLAP